MLLLLISRRLLLVISSLHFSVYLVNVVTYFLIFVSLHLFLILSFFSENLFKIHCGWGVRKFFLNNRIVNRHVTLSDKTAAGLIGLCIREITIKWHFTNKEKTRVQSASQPHHHRGCIAGGSIAAILIHRPPKNCAFPLVDLDPDLIYGCLADISMPPNSISVVELTNATNVHRCHV